MTRASGRANKASFFHDELLHRLEPGTKPSSTSLVPLEINAINLPGESAAPLARQGAVDLTRENTPWPPPPSPPSRAARTRCPSRSSRRAISSASACGSWSGRATPGSSTSAKREANKGATWWPGRMGDASSSSASGCGRSTRRMPARRSRSFAVLPIEDQPHELVFVVSRAVSADTRKRHPRRSGATRRPATSGAATSLMSGSSAIRSLLEEFFQLPSVKERTALPRNLPFSSLGPLFQGREEMITTLREKLTQIARRPGDGDRGQGGPRPGRSGQDAAGRGVCMASRGGLHRTALRGRGLARRSAAQPRGAL